MTQTFETIEEHQPLLHPIKCWACWETYDNNPTNRLIRVCNGCKDPDLQFIHQQCINKYITNFINAKHPEESICDQVPFVSPETLKAIHTSSNHDNNNNNGMGCAENNNNNDLHWIGLHCTRCTDKYHVSATPVPIITVLAHDRVMRILYPLFTLTICTFSILCLTMLIISLHFAQQATTQQDLDRLKIDVIGNEMKVDVRLFNILILAVYLVLGGVVFQFTKSRFSGYQKIQVHPAP